MTNESMHRARVAYENADFEACLAELEGIAKDGNAPPLPRARACADAAVLLRMLGRRSESTLKAREGDALFTKLPEPLTPETFAEHAALLAELDPERSAEVLEKGHGNHPEDPEIALELLRSLSGEDDQRARRRVHKLARELERGLMETAPGPERDFRLGRLYFSMGEPKRARARLQAVLESEPGNAASPTRRFLIRLYLLEGDYPAAEMLAEAEVRALPHDTAPLHLLARTYLHAYNLDQAAAEYEKLVTRDPEHAETWSGLGMVQLFLGRDGLDTYSRAAQLFTRALECTQATPAWSAKRAEYLRARAHARAKLYERDPRSGYEYLVQAQKDLQEALKLSDGAHETRVVLEDALRILRSRGGFARGLELIKLWGPAAASLLSLLVFGLTQAWLFIDIAARPLTVPAYITLTLGSLASGLGGLFLTGRNRIAGDELPLQAPTIGRNTYLAPPPLQTEPRFPED